jgi:hypothetical protein
LARISAQEPDAWARQDLLDFGANGVAFQATIDCVTRSLALLNGFAEFVRAA